MVAIEEARLIERVRTPRGELALRRRGDVFELISNGVFLMDSGDGRSERLLARVATEMPSVSSVLVAGLGFGFTLEEVLEQPRIQHVTVVEVEEAVVRWNSGPLAPLNGNALLDPRVRVAIADLRCWLVEFADRFDAICMDVDNGPDWTVTDDNRRLYTADGLGVLRDHLTPGGLLAIWSSSPSKRFEARLARVFASVRCESVPTATGPPDVVWVARERA